MIDLLPNRSTETVAAWLRQHASVEVVSRDRASSFADAIAKGAPGAVRVADRWHLLNNLFETLIRSLERHRRTMNDVARQIVRKGVAPAVAEVQEAPSTQALRRKLRNREHRLSIYQELMSLVDAGMNHSEASRQMGVGLRTVQRWLACGVFPEWKHRVFPSIVDAYGPHLREALRRRLPEHIAALARTQRSRLRRSVIDRSRLAAAAFRISEEGDCESAYEEGHSYWTSTHRMADAEDQSHKESLLEGAIPCLCLGCASCMPHDFGLRRSSRKLMHRLHQM